MTRPLLRNCALEDFAGVAANEGEAERGGALPRSNPTLCNSWSH